MTVLDARHSNSKEGGPSFPLKHRLFRLSWNLTWGLFGRLSPVPLHSWRRFLLRSFGAKIHSTAKIYPSAKIWYPPNLTMAAHSCLAPRVNCYCMDTISVGEHALVSQGAHLCGGTHDIFDSNFQLKVKPIVIGNNAWIAAEAFVGPGVTVGEHAVLGACGVTFKDLDPGTVYAGNPAEVLRPRYQKASR